MTRKQWQLFWFVSIIWFGLIVVVHYHMDFPVSRYVHASFNPNSKFISFVHIWSDFGYGWPYLVGFAVLFLLGKFVLHKPRLAFYSAYLWCCAAISGVICDLLKLIFGRPRPSLLFDHHVSQFIFMGHRTFNANGYTSFPSGHATTAASVAIGVMLLFPRWRIVSIAMMLSVAAARVLLLRHYVADVMAGMYLGTVTAYFLYRYMQGRFSVALQGVLVK
jgi:membrane-associated phospholipid phosphatase